MASGQGEDYSERVGGLVQDARRHPCQGLSVQVYLWEERCMGRSSFFKSVATPVLSSKPLNPLNQMELVSVTCHQRVLANYETLLCPSPPHLLLLCDSAQPFCPSPLATGTRLSPMLWGWGSLLQFPSLPGSPELLSGASSKLGAQAPPSRV